MTPGVPKLASDRQDIYLSLPCCNHIQLNGSLLQVHSFPRRHSVLLFQTVHSSRSMPTARTDKQSAVPRCTGLLRRSHSFALLLALCVASLQSRRGCGRIHLSMEGETVHALLIVKQDQLADHLSFSLRAGITRAVLHPAPGYYPHLQAVDDSSRMDWRVIFTN